MKKYEVTVKEVHSFIIEVEAENEEKAIENAFNQYQYYEDPELNYEYALDKKEWDSEEIPQ